MIIELTGLNSSEHMIVINVVKQKRLTQSYWKRNASCARKHASLNFKLLCVVRRCISEKRVEKREAENEFLRMNN